MPTSLLPRPESYKPTIVIAAASAGRSEADDERDYCDATWNQVTAVLLQIKIALAAQDNFPYCITLSFLSIS